MAWLYCLALLLLPWVKGYKKGMVSVPRQVSRTGSISQVPLGRDAEWSFYSEVISSPDSGIEAACHSFANATDASANHDHYKRGVGKVTHWVRVSATKPDDKSLILSTHMVERELIPKGCPLTSTNALWQMHTCGYTYECINTKLFFFYSAWPRVSCHQSAASGHQKSPSAR